MNLFVYEFMETMLTKEAETNESIAKMINDFNKIDLSNCVNRTKNSKFINY